MIIPHREALCFSWIAGDEVKKYVCVFCDMLSSLCVELVGLHMMHINAVLQVFNEASNVIDKLITMGEEEDK